MAIKITHDPTDSKTYCLEGLSSSIKYKDERFIQMLELLFSINRKSEEISELILGKNELVVRIQNASTTQRSS
ncbi:MAG: hypothetical protein GTO02_06720 [Candidatus Dadabacteria bacterium]|nr:hypothetical protein [Candidatus Dadabacteria bacterium]